MKGRERFRRQRPWSGHGFRAARLPVAAIALAILTQLAPGCYHILMPVSPPRLPDDVAPLRIQPRRIVRLVNGYADSEIIWFRTEGIHHIGADLREWTDRLLSQLQIELEPRGVSTAITDGQAPANAEAIGLRVRITGIRPPSSAGDAFAPDDPQGGGGPVLEATIESEDGTYEADYSSGATSHGFTDAFYHLKEAILVEGSLVEWLRLRSQRNRRDAEDAGPGAE